MTQWVIKGPGRKLIGGEQPEKLIRWQEEGDE
jgi:hypothetical protein